MFEILGKIFSTMMSWCYLIVNNYGMAIIVFTLLTKVIMLPISILVQINSIKMVEMYPEMNRIKAKFYGSKDLISEENYKLYKKKNYHPMLDLVPVVAQLVLLMGVVEGLKRFEVSDTFFLGVDLSLVPAKVGGITILIPVLAALAAWFMCACQNKMNVLQAEQSKANKISTLTVSVLLSLYLGFFVEGGVGLYWIMGNLSSVLLLIVLNICINPKKYVNYDELEKSRKELEKVVVQSTAAKKMATKEELSREKADYKRFFKYGRKQIVFYSEKNGFYKYYKSVIETIIKKTDIVIHYITSDINDEIFAMSSEQFQTYYIGESKLIVLMMKLEADIVVMTMPDLEKYHIKRSLVDKKIEYIYLDHGINSQNMMLRKHALDYFDTVFASNEVGYNEIRAQEKTYGLAEKNLLKFGSPLIDSMIHDYENQQKQGNEKVKILIAPSWQDENIMDLCVDDILDRLLGKGYQIVVRPHPQYVRHFSDKLDAMKDKYSGYDDFLLQTDFAANDTVFNADILITDWSGIAYEYAFTTLKPVLFVNTPMKVMNPDYEEIGVVPFDLAIRDKVGISLEASEVKTIDVAIDKLIKDTKYSKESIGAIRSEYLYNVGNSGNVGAKYIIQRLIERTKK